ncbi:glutamate--tRNA ligase [endosymbiont of Pachyrhynchus infernalis]|uniref:glutamate--tRNA ligase n=1 Tax=endosymbiont of Pachyrhynchus infernalis TaxID=1971488 RepID=UPI000DC6D9C1|nr:glutamate--tRNA ligase [endosymbiont of Pachyrhynchus infernalis]BBA84899.1 glutamate--tRNA ligase [endosymbiont of Pachyrhynchus infernalis]
MKNINTRFAPSPTGNLHIGNIRIAIYSWLFSKKYNGNFFLRIENTKEKNSFYINKIIYQLKWLKISWNKKIIYQSNRNKKYEKIIKLMIKNNKAYYCFCSKERLKNIKETQILNKEKPKYDKLCRNLNYKTIYNNIKNNKKFVIRFKNPDKNYTYFNDLIYGNLKFNNKELDDLIIKKSNGYFTYNFCSTVDDFYMKITHIIRGNDHISNTPRQINILKSLNCKIPKYIHVPITLDINKNKISKHNNNYNIEELIKEGFLYESILHFITNPNIINNIINIKYIINNFNINKISKSSIIFDKKKLLYINKLYISKLSIYKIRKRIFFYLKYTNNKFIINKNINKILKIFKNRFSTFNELFIITKYIFYNNNINIQEIYLYINSNKELIEIITKFLKNINNITIWRISNIKNIINKLLKNKNINIKKKFYFIIRKLISGVDKTPELYYIIYLIGKKNTIERINLIINYYL